MYSQLIQWFLITFAISFVLTRIVAFVSAKVKLVDQPIIKRKIHSTPVPLLGGLAIFFAVALTIVILLIKTDLLTSGEVHSLQYFGFIFGGLILMIGGFIDDRYNLSPKYAIVAPILAALCVIGFGIEIDKLTNPFGGFVYLESWQSDVIVFVWLMVVMYTTKFLDGLDGLATSISGVGTLMVLLLAMTVAFYQPDVALFSAVALGGLLGFLLWNFHPAFIFLGEGGSTFVGFMLGTLAVISGSKVATALLVLGIPLLDLIWVIVRRMSKGGIKQIFKGDRKHLHHRLFDIGFGQRKIVVLYVLFASTFGVLTLILQSREKIIALILLILIMIIGANYIVIKEKQKHA